MHIGCVNCCHCHLSLPFLLLGISGLFSLIPEGSAVWIDGVESPGEGETNSADIQVTERFKLELKVLVSSVPSGPCFSSLPFRVLLW